ncbi:MAG: hypothetical protein U1F54_14565 [Burkholderiales bacterium]
MSLDSAVDRLDAISFSRLLIPNGAIAIFVFLAHGGWLLLARAGKAPAGDLRWVPYVSVPIALVFIALTLVAAFYPNTRERVLRIQALGLGCLAALCLLFALVVLAVGPGTEQFVWNPVLFAFLLAYPVYQVRRVLVPPTALRKPLLRYAHIIAAALGLLLSMAVMWRASAA